VAAYLSLEINLGFGDLDRGVPVSIIGYLLPASILSNPSFLATLKVIFWLSAACWLSVPFLSAGSGRFLRWFMASASWLAYLTYTVMASVYWENLPFYLHKFVLPSWLLLIHALWYHFYSDDIIAAVKQRAFWTSALYPRWAYSLSVYTIAVFYTMSGLSKVTSAFDWGNGLSLQLWTTRYGDFSSEVTQLVMRDRAWARFFQSGALALECSSWLSIFHPILRTLIGIGLLMFHSAVDMTFHIDFRPNMVLISVFLLPIFDLWGARNGRRENESQPDSVMH